MPPLPLTRRSMLLGNKSHLLLLLQLLLITRLRSTQGALVLLPSTTTIAEAAAAAAGSEPMENMLPLDIPAMPIATTATTSSSAMADSATVVDGEGGGGVGDLDDCRRTPLEVSLYCRGSRAIRNVIHNLSKSDKPIVLFRGLEIVPTSGAAAAAQPLTTIGGGGERATFLESFADYLRTHELNVKFSDLLGDESAPYLARDGDGNGINGITEARKKDKGQGLVLAMAMMSAKMMAMLGLGGIAALAMKALGVALMALVLAGLVGLKSMAQHGGGDNSHSVSYVTSEGHHHHKRRRRRSDDQHGAYSGWPYATVATAAAAPAAAA